MTDDVLAIEATGATVQAHRAARSRASIPASCAALTPSERRTLGAVRVRGEKWHVAPALAPARLPLALTYHLVRPADGAASGSSPVRPYDPALLLGSAFLSYFTAPERLRRQLESCAAIARSTPLYQVRAGAEATSADVADAVLRHAEVALGERAP